MVVEVRILNPLQHQHQENTPIPFPTTVPVPGDIPTFKELVAPALAGTAAVINMTQGAWECMGKAVSGLWKQDDGNYKI